MREPFSVGEHHDDKLIQYHERNALAQWVIGREKGVLGYFHWANKLITGDQSRIYAEQRCIEEARRRVIIALNSRDRLESA